MTRNINIGKCLSDGLSTLKRYFWPYILVVIILAILDSLSNGPAVRGGMEQGQQYFSQGLIAALISIFIKPVFDYGARLLFIRGHRGEQFEIRDLVIGFDSKKRYLDIILTHMMLVVLIVAGLICLVLPGLYIACRVILTSYLVMDKGLAPRQALNASWALSASSWPQVILLGLLALLMMLGGAMLLLVGLLPAMIWSQAMFAAYYQQVLDAHDEDTLRRLDIEP